MKYFSRASRVRARGLSLAGLFAALLFGCAATALAEHNPANPEVSKANQATDKTKIILLGTAGGPTPKPRNAPASALIVDGKVYIIDAEDGMARQLFLSGTPLRDVRAVFITHHHSDYNADYGNLLLLSWVVFSGDTSRLKV